MSDLLSFRNPAARIAHWKCQAGEKWVLVAPTGWGKSQWLRQLTLLRDADATELKWRDKLVTAKDAPHFRSRWLLLSQHAYRSTDTLLVHLKEVLALRSEIDSTLFLGRFREAMEALGLAALDPSKRLMRELSGGELQLTGLIRSALLQPEGIFLDEPTSALDGALRQKAEAWFLQNFTGAFLWVSHDGDQVTRLRAVGAQLVPL